MIFKKSIFLTLFVMIGMGITSCSDSKEQGEPDSPEQPTPSAKFTKRYNSGMTLYSNKLQQEVSYSVLLPQEYLNGSTERYDVMYLLHGYGETESTWETGHFDIQNVDTQARAAGLVRPIIYVMPRGYNSYYVNRYDGSFNYMDMLTQELIPLIDRMFRTNATAKSRAVAGYSMGGFGALAVASKNPNLFGTCIGLSPSLNTDEQYIYLGAWDSQWGSIFGGVGSIGEARLTSHYKSLCPLHFFASNPSQYSSINYLVDCGDDEERLYIGNGELHSLMRDNGVRHEYRVRNGAHTSAYWREGLKEGLSLFEHTLAGTAYPAEETSTIPAAQLPEAETIANGEVALYHGSTFGANATSHVIYFNIGTGVAGLTREDVAEALGSIITTRNVAVAVFDDAYLSATGASDLFTSVENHLNLTDTTDARRQLYIYGKGGKPFIEYAFSGAAVGGLYLEDSDAVIPEDATFKARAYILDIPDMGVHYKEMLAAFCTLRLNEASVQYRVRNGEANRTSAMQGIFSTISFMNVPVK